MKPPRVVHRAGLEASASPYRLVDGGGAEIGWINQFLDMQCVRGLAAVSLRSYAGFLSHFLRWWQCQPGVDVTRLEVRQFTESTLIDYVRYQRNRVPPVPAAVVNGRSAMLRRLFEFHFHQPMPHSPCLIRPHWKGRARKPAADLTVRVPPRVIEPLSLEQVQRFWSSFHNCRDLAVVGLMLLNGLRSCEVLSLEVDDLLLSEARIRVRGKGAKVRWLPLPPETIQLLDCYMRTERPHAGSSRVFLSRKGRARGKPMTAAGLRSLFRYHRSTSGVANANPHRFRHTFCCDMIRAGVSLPALQRLMGHSDIQTTLLYIHVSPQEVFDEYARAVKRQVSPPGIARP